MTSESLAALKQNLRALQAQGAAGTLTQAEYDQQKAELERQILDHVLSDAVPSHRLNGRLVVAAIGVLAFVVGGAGYWWSTANRTPAPIAAEASLPVQAHMGGEQATAPAHNNDQMTSMVDRLALRLKTQPQDVEGWAMLARSYTVLGRTAEAIKAYEKAVALRKDDATLLADYADTLAVQNNRQLAGEPMRWVERALRVEPANPKALSMAGSAAFDRQDFAKAVQYWEQLVANAPPDHPIVQQVLPSLDQARALTGKPATTPRTPVAGGLAASMQTLRKP